MPAMPSCVDMMTLYLPASMVGIDKYTQRASFRVSLPIGQEDCVSLHVLFKTT